MNVSEKSPDNSSSFGFHDVDCWAITYPDPNIPTIKFRWSIRNFLQMHDATNKTASPCFGGDFEGKGGIGNHWQVVLETQTGPNTGRDFLSVHVYLASMNQVSENPFRPETIPARFQICLLESDGSIFRSTGPFTQFHKFTHRNGWGFNSFCLVDHLRTNPERLLQGGDLLLTCEIQIETPHISVVGRGGVRNEIRNNQSNSLSRLAIDFGNLLHGGLSTDFTINVVDNQNQKTMDFAVHKVVLAARSEVFRAMFTFSENKQISTVIEDFNVKVVAAMVEYMYTGMVDERLMRKRAQDLLRIADYYNLEELHNQCETVMAENLDVENAMDILVFADKFNCHYLKQVTVQFISCHKKDVVETSGFKKISATHPHLIVDLYLS